ncbi:unnamed protein product [Pleuronectes platessa]|uniref:Uncharacterized protein n=1 Tax=Pleuronectes platessa TaxID=8262 RepID=A0A9N7VI49_PLEPL|nr:unnamed protein product [Pleuronectes platessa]
MSAVSVGECPALVKIASPGSVCFSWFLSAETLPCLALDAFHMDPSLLICRLVFLICSQAPTDKQPLCSSASPESLTPTQDFPYRPCALTSSSTQSPANLSI